MPRWPIMMPSEAVGAPKTCGTPPPARMPSRAFRTILSRWALQGVMSECRLAMPIMGRVKSPSWKPTARSMARLGARLGPWVVVRLDRCDDMGHSPVGSRAGAVTLGQPAEGGNAFRPRLPTCPSLATIHRNRRRDLGMHQPPRRRERLARQLSGEGLGALLVTSPVNVTYLTGFTGDSSALVLTPSRAVLVSDPRYVGQIADECPDLETAIRTPTVKLHDAIGQTLKRLGPRAVGCESGALTLAEAEALKAAGPTIDWKPASDRVEKLRMVK